jgi:hypothetical protein
MLRVEGSLDLGPLTGDWQRIVTATSDEGTQIHSMACAHHCTVVLLYGPPNIRIHVCCITAAVSLAGIILIQLHLYPARLDPSHRCHSAVSPLFRSTHPLLLEFMCTPLCSSTVFPCTPFHLPRSHSPHHRED